LREEQDGWQPGSEVSPEGPTRQVERAMLTRFQIPLRPVERWAVLPAAHGRAVRALLYYWLGRGNGEFAARLHARSGAPRPFACSMLLGAGEAQHGAHLLSSDGGYWIEFCALTEEARAVLAAGLPEEGERVRIARTQVAVSGPPVVTEQQAYSELLEAPPSTRWRFRFLSPVVIEPEGSDQPLLLPIPRYLFSGLVLRWNALVVEESKGIPTFPVGAALAYVEETVRLLHVGALRTVSLNGPAGGLRGFTGEIELAAAPDDSANLRALGALVRFAAWAGVGGRTLEGAGRTEVEWL